MTAATISRTSTQAPSTVGVRARGITKSFHVDGSKLPVLNGVSLEVESGEMVSVMGPSGSGKSTLLYCLAGLEHPDEGTVEVHGQEIARLSRADLARMRRTDVGFVFQSYNLIPTLSAFDNVALPHMLAGDRPDRAVIERTLEDVGLGHRIDARPPSMSGGEQQRVALARALAQQPAVVFADEPTGALDTRSGEVVLDKLKEISRAPGQCVLLVTHDPGVAAHCDRVVFMRDGELVDEIRPKDAGHVAGVLTGLTDNDTRATRD